MADSMCQFEGKESEDMWPSVHSSWEYASTEHLRQQGLAVSEGQQQDTEDQVHEAVSGLAARIPSKDWYKVE